MLYCPLRSPVSFSKRLPSGTSRSVNASAASSIASLRQATRCTGPSSRRDRWRCQMASASLSRKDRSTGLIITRNVINATRYQGRSASAACHTRATRQGAQRAVTVTQGHSPADGLHRRSHRSPAKPGDRTSKLVMRVRFPPPAPGIRPRSGLFFDVRLHLAGPSAGPACHTRATRTPGSCAFLPAFRFLCWLVRGAVYRADERAESLGDRLVAVAGGVLVDH